MGTTETDAFTHRTDDLLEDNVRSTLSGVQERLRALRIKRKDVDAEVRDLVADEKTLKRLVAVFDRAKAKSA